MRGLTFPGDRKVEFVEFADPTPGFGEVVIEVKASGFCGSDLHSYRRTPGTPVSTRRLFPEGPIIAGHEPCGIIAAVGPGVSDNVGRVGDRVMVYHYAGCSTCGHCRSGWAQHCEEVDVHSYGNNDHGAHAPYMKVPAETVMPLPDELSFAAGAAISCGTGTAYGAIRRLAVSGKDTIAIFGQGPVGLAATQVAKAMGAKVIALDLSDTRLDQARAFGADFTINVTDHDALEVVKQLTGGRGADAALDTSGSQPGRASAVRCLKTWGSACFVGEGGEVRLNVSADLIRRQITLMGSWTFSAPLQMECARFVIERGIDVDAIFSHRWRLDQAEEAYRLFDTQATGKAVFDFQ